MLSINDQLETNETKSRNENSFFTLPLKERSEENDKVIHTWLVNEFEALKKGQEDRHANIKKNLALNKGLLYKDDEKKSTDDREANKKREYTKVVSKILKKSNEVRASRLLKYKPAFAILPTNDELADKIAAESCENIVQHIWYTQRFDGVVLPDLVNEKGITGEKYLFILWNPDLGDLHKDYKKAVEFQKKNKLEKVPLLTDAGVVKKDDSGKDIYIEKPVKNGDVEYVDKSALECFFHQAPSKKFKDAKHVFFIEELEVDEARFKYPQGATHIKGNKDFQFYDVESGATYNDARKTQIIHFYHRRCPMLDKGRWVIFTADGLIDNKDFPFSHYELPCVRFHDLSNPGEQHAVSFFDDVKGKSGAYNNLTNMILRNEYLVGHPKWMMPAGAADIKDLANGITIVQYKGPVPPALVQANPTGMGAYNLRQAFKEEILEDSDVSRTGNGNPPQGITAAVALQYLSELEAERWNQPVLSHNESIIQVVMQTICVAGDYYDSSDERMMRIQGEGNEWMSEMIDVAVLAKDYDVRVQNSSAVAESKSARIQTLMDLAEKFPDRVDPDQVLDLYEFAQSKKFVKEATISLRAAEAENQMIIQGKEVNEPQIYEDSITHWKSHVKKAREWAFKNRVPDDRQKALTDHILATEMLLMQGAAKSQALAAKVATLEGFPLFYVAEPQPTSDKDLPPEGEMPTAGAAPLDQGLPPVDPGAPVQEAGEDVNPALPPIAVQEGLEDQAQVPNNSI